MKKLSIMLCIILLSGCTLSQDGADNDDYLYRASGDYLYEEPDDYSHGTSGDDSQGVSGGDSHGASGDDSRGIIGDDLQAGTDGEVDSHDNPDNDDYSQEN
ncbi:MAG: hypothetical protein HAW59_06145 [Betaproteobacteria bacterium]|nr:hypothetical protein [Betaproteobacteria bacterium]